MKRGIEQLRLAIAEWIMGDLAIWFVPKRWKPVYLQAVVLAMAQTFDTETLNKLNEAMKAFNGRVAR